MGIQNNRIRTAVIFFSLAGAFIMAYLLYLHYAPTPEGGAFCDFGEKISCDIVNKSGYSEFFGVPMAGFGVLYFTLVFMLALLRFNERTLVFIASLLIVLLGPSLYLTVVSTTVLKSFCIFCELAKIFMTLIAALAIYAIGFRNFGTRVLLVSLSLAIALASISYFIHRKTVVDPFTFKSNVSLQEFLK